MTTKRKPKAPAAPPPVTVDEVNAAFNETIQRLVTTRHVPHMLMLGALRAITLNLEAEFLAAQAASRGG